jgi:type IV secretory pathway VirB2 component (pilin)
MLYIKIKNFLCDNRRTILLLLSLFLYTALYPTPALAGSAAPFSSLSNAGGEIFRGLRKIIYPASTIGIACVCIGGMFGNFNWKWLAAILIGIFVISAAAGVAGLAGSEGVDLEGTS